MNPKKRVNYLCNRKVLCSIQAPSTEKAPCWDLLSFWQWFDKSRAWERAQGGAQAVSSSLFELLIFFEQNIHTAKFFMGMGMQAISGNKRLVRVAPPCTPYELICTRKKMVGDTLSGCACPKIDMALVVL